MNNTITFTIEGDHRFSKITSKYSRINSAHYNAEKDQTTFFIQQDESVLCSAQITVGDESVEQRFGTPKTEETNRKSRAASKADAEWRQSVESRLDTFISETISTVAMNYKDRYKLAKKYKLDGVAKRMRDRAQEENWVLEE